MTNDRGEGDANLAAPSRYTQLLSSREVGDFHSKLQTTNNGQRDFPNATMDPNLLNRKHCSKYTINEAFDIIVSVCSIFT